VFRCRFRLLGRIDGSDRFAHVCQAQWLDQVGARTGSHGSQCMAWIVMRGKHDAGRRRRTSRECCQQGQAVHAGKRQVAHDQIDAALRQQRQRFLGCAGAMHGKAQFLQNSRCQHPFHGTVIDHECTAGNRNLNA
jgi:hypothetical protein